MSAPGILLPTLKARVYPPSGSGEYDGLLTIDLSKNSLFMVVFKQDKEAVLCDVDDVVVDSKTLVVTFSDSLNPRLFQLLHSSDVSLLQSLIRTCQDIFGLSLRINTAVRDCLHSGIRSGGAMPSVIDDRHVLSTLADIVHRDLPVVYASSTAAATAAGSSVGGAAAAAAAPVARATRKVPRKCFFCQMGAKKYQEENIIIHPYVTCDYKGADIYMCLKCVSNWKLYREAAKKAKELVLPGETNEELCALCSSLPDTLVLCETCPRSFCEVCLSIVIGQAEFRKMKSQANWRCMECTVSERKRERNVEIVESKKTSNKRDKAVSPGGTKNHSAVDDDISVEPPKKRSHKRKHVGDHQDVEQIIEVNGVQSMSPVAPFPVKEQEAKELDELFYFGQYLKTQDEVYDCFRTRPAMLSPSTAVRGSVRNALKKEARANRLEEDECSEDYCLLCKDGGELIECDYVHHIFSETYLSHSAAGQLSNIAPKSPSNHNNLVRKRCRKVYHACCLGFDVDVDYWQCPKHYCAAGKCRNVPYFSCDLCPVSFCKQCAFKSGEMQGRNHKYIEVALVSEYSGKEQNPTAPNTERMRIICNSCIDTAEKCFDRGEVTSENLLWLLRTNVKSFDRKSDLYDPKSTAAPMISSPLLVALTPPKSSRDISVAIVKSEVTRITETEEKIFKYGTNKLWSDDDLEYFSVFLKEYKPSPEVTSGIGAVLRDAVFWERMSKYDEGSIRQKFHKIVKRLQLDHLVLKRKKSSMI